MEAEEIERRTASLEEPAGATGTAADTAPASCISCTTEATLPLRVSQKWVAHACRMAGVGKPRWNRHTSVWTATGTREDGTKETIEIRQGSSPTIVVIVISWEGPDGSPAESATARKLVTAFFTGMQWSLRHTKTPHTTLGR